MRHIQVKLTVAQAKFVKPLAIDEYGEVDNDGTIESMFINKAPYKGVIKLTTKLDIMYFSESNRDTVYAALIDCGIRGSKALAEKVKKA